MWIFTRDGFISIVQHDTDPDLLRVRARRREHLTNTFNDIDADIIDYGETAPDYRWHLDIPRLNVMAAMTDALQDLDYVSHVKEEVAGTDNAMYMAMLGCWTAMMRLQRPDPTPTDWWAPPVDDDDLTGLASDVAGRMMRTLDDDVRWADDDQRDDDPLPTRLFPAGLDPLGGTECMICGNELNSGDGYVMLPEDTEFGDPEGPAHTACAIDEGWEVAT